MNAKNIAIVFAIIAAAFYAISGMVVLDILALIFLMMGLKYSSAANVLLLNNFEIVATSLIAMIIFRSIPDIIFWIAIIIMGIGTYFAAKE